MNQPADSQVAPSFRSRFAAHLKRYSTKLKNRLGQIVNKWGFRIIGRLPAKKNLVMFESFSGKQYSCNPRALYEYMSENDPDFALCWSADRRHTMLFKERQVPYAKRFSFKWIWMMARARYWVINTRMPTWLPKPANTKTLQTWHGTPLKRLASDMDEVHMPGTTMEQYKENFIREAGRWDALISPNAYSSKIFQRAFQFDGPMLETGYPRNDYLYTHNNQDEIDTIKRQCGIPQHKKAVLYAPTWRDDQFFGKGRYKFDLDLDLDRMQEALGDEYVIFLRMHYLVAENFDLSPYEGFAFDLSGYEDIRSLYLISDLLITDYSSVFFDYANLYRPVIFYVYDVDRYRDTLRGFYFDIEQNAPGPLVKTTESVIDAIKDFEALGFRVPESFEDFYQRFCYLEDGKSSSRVVTRFFSQEPNESEKIYMNE